MSPAPAGVAAARGAAYAVLRRVFEHGAYADRALYPVLEGLSPRDRALVTQLVYGTVQRRDTLDHVLGLLAARPRQQPAPAVQAALRLGLFQLLYLDAVPAHAAVGESVELVKHAAPSACAFVNAVLRRADREGRSILAGLDDLSPETAAILHSVPRWLAEMWFSELGEADARALLAVVNRPAEVALRANTLRRTRDSLLEMLPVAARPAGDLPEGVIVDGGFDAHGSSLFADGSLMPQSRASMLAAHVVGPQPGERVLDLCAAPGAKTSHIAALMEDRGEILAVERHPGRAAALRRTAQRLGASTVRVEVADAAAFASGRRFHRVLVDPPCSGLGTLQSRPDLRWRVRAEAVAELGRLQLEIVLAGARALAPGGTLTYSVCTISRVESHDVVQALLREAPELRPDPLSERWPELATPGSPHLQLLPHRDGTDGFFIARLRRRG